MDLQVIFQEFVKGIDVALVLGIILFVAAVRWVLSSFKIEVPEGILRVFVLGLGMCIAFFKVDYQHGLIAELFEVIAKAFTYGGAATLVYQLYKAGWKKLFPEVEEMKAPPDIPEDHIG